MYYTLHYIGILYLFKTINVNKMYKIRPHPPSTDRETNNYQKQFKTRGRPVKQSRFRFTRHLTHKMVGRYNNDVR